jgi:hypothetical protein
MLSMLFKIGADATGVERAAAAAAGKAGKAFSSMGKEITGRLAGMFAAGAVLDRITGFTQAVIDNADALDEMSDLMGMSIEDIQRLQTAANLAGVPFKKLKGVLDGINASKEQAITGDAKKQQLFAALGVDPASASALQILEAAAGAKKGTPAAAAAADILGKKMGDILAVMRALKGLGPVDLITSEQAKRIAQAKDDLEEAGRRLKVSATPAVTAGLSALGNVFDALNIMVREKVPLPVAMFREITRRSTEGGVDLSALPLPPGKSKPTQKTGVESTAAAVASIPPAPLALQSDALARIGLFVGGRGDAGNQLVTIGNYQLSELRAIRAELQHANR